MEPVGSLPRVGLSSSDPQREFRRWAAEVFIWRGIAVVFWQFLMSLCLFYLFSWRAATRCGLFGVFAPFQVTSAALYAAAVSVFVLGFLRITSASLQERKGVSYKPSVGRIFVGGWFQHEKIQLLFLPRSLFFITTGAAVGAVCLSLSWDIQSTSACPSSEPLQPKIQYSQECTSGFCIQQLPPYAIGAMFGVLLAFQTLVQQRYTLDFPIVQRTRLLRFKSMLPATCCSALRNALVMSFILFVLQVMFMVTGLNLNNELQSYDLFSKDELSILYNLIQGTFLIAACWELGACLLQIALTQELSLSATQHQHGVCARHEQSQNMACLLHGLAYASGQQNAKTAGESLVGKLSVLELQQISYHEPVFRKELFDDTSGNVWMQVMTSCCMLVDTLTLDLQRHIHHHKLEQSEHAKWRDLWLKKGQIAPLMTRVKRGLEVYSCPSTESVYSLLFSNGQVVVWAVRALTQVVVSSKYEDRIGVVQSSNGLATVLSCLLKCQLALEEFLHVHAWRNVQVGAVGHPLSHGKSRLMGQVVRFGKEKSSQTRVTIAFGPCVMHSVFVEAVYHIVSNYQEFISSMTITPELVERLQQYVNCRE